MEKRMSPEERARVVAYKHCGDLIPLADAIAAAIRAAVAEERERCAGVAQNDGMRALARGATDETEAAERIAAAIREEPT